MGLSDRDSDGFYEYYNFDIGILANVFAPSAQVRAKIISTETGRVFPTPSWTIPLPGNAYQPWAFTDLDFAADLFQETWLQFDIELWDPGFAIRWDSVPMYVEYLPVEPYFPYLDEVRIQNLFYITDADGDGYYEEFEFDIAIDADMELGTRMAAARVLCVQTGQIWTVEPWQVSGIDNSYQLKSFWETMFSGFQGNTALYFKVELWDQAFSVKLDETWDIVGQPVLADNTVLPDSVTIEGYAAYLDETHALRPIRLATVRARDLELPVFQYETHTEMDGYFTLTIPNDADANGIGADVQVSVETKGYGFSNPVPWLVHEMIEVKDPQSGEPHRWFAENVYNNTSSYLSIDLIADNVPLTEGYFSVYDAGIEAYSRAFSEFGMTLPDVTIFWPMVSGITHFEPSTSAIWVERRDRWDRDVIIHEYGHFIAQEYGFAQGQVSVSVHD